MGSNPKLTTAAANKHSSNNNNKTNLTYFCDPIESLSSRCLFSCTESIPLPGRRAFVRWIVGSQVEGACTARGASTRQQFNTHATEAINCPTTIQSKRKQHVQSTTTMNIY
jgi:hypothetical protein